MRLLTRLIAALFALALAVLGALAAVETGWALLRPQTPGLLIPWRATAMMLGDVRWSDPGVRGGAAVVIVVGVLLLLFSISAHRRSIRLHDPAPAVRVVTNRHSLARLVAHRVRTHEGVESASVTARRTRVHVRASVSSPDTRQARASIGTSARQAVEELPLPRQPRVSVSVSEAKEPS